MLIANADRLTEITCHSPNLINTDLSECTLLQRIDLSDSVLLGTGIGAQPILNIQNCKYLRYCNCMNTQLTAIYTMQQGGNLEELYFPETTQVIQVTNQTYLKTIGIPCGYKNLYNQYTDFSITTTDAYTQTILGVKYISIDSTKTYVWGTYNTSLCFPNPTLSGQANIYLVVKEYDSNYTFISDKALTYNSFIYPNKAEVKFNYTPTNSTVKYVKLSFTTSIKSGAYGESATNVSLPPLEKIKYFMFCESSDWKLEANPKNLATVQITNCNALRYIQYPFLSSDTIKFDSLKYVQNLSIINSMPTLTEMSFRGFNKLRNVTLQNLQNLTTLGFDNMLGASDVSTFKTMTLSNMPKVTKLTFNVDSANYKIAFAGAGKIDMGGLQSALTIESNYSIKGLDTIILPTSIKELRFATTYGDGINELKNLWSATSNHASDGFTGIDFQDMTINFIDMLGLSQVSNAINFNIAPVDQHPNMNTNRDGTATKPYFKPVGTINLNNYTGSMANMLKGVDLSLLTVILDNEKSQTDLTSLFQGATIVEADKTKINNILSKFPYSTIWDYMFAYSTIQSLEGINIGTGKMSLKGWAKGSSITADITIPANAIAVDEMFMNCLSITSITANWNNTYTYTITATNCYAGCSSVDLDEVPTAWGGRGFGKNVTGIYVVNIPSDNYTVTTAYPTDSYHFLEDGIVNWGDGTTSSKTTTHTYAKAGTYTIKGKMIFAGYGYAAGGNIRDVLIEVRQLPLNATVMQFGFSGFTKLTKVTAYNFRPTDCGALFADCTALTEIVGFETWDMSNCYTLGSCFKNCIGLSNFDFMKSWDLSKLTNIGGCFSYSGVVDLSILKYANLQKVTNMNSICSYAPNLKSFVISSNATITDSMYMFDNCPALVEVDLSSVSIVTNIYSAQIFMYNVPNLYSFKFFKSYKLKDSGNCYPFANVNNINFSVTALLSILNGLYNYVGESTEQHGISIGSTNLAKLTTEQIAIATNKGWTLV